MEKLSDYKRVRVPRSYVKGCNGCELGHETFLCFTSKGKCMVEDSQKKIRFYIFVPKEKK